MTTTISDYVSVSEKIAELGCLNPKGLVLLPTNFESASSIFEFRQVSEAATVKKLFRSVGIPQGDIVGIDQRPPYIQYNAFEWVAPILFISAAFYSENPNFVSIALSVIANYATDFFKGMTGKNRVKLDIVVERKKAFSCKKISYQGDVEGLKTLPDIIREVANE